MRRTAIILAALTLIGAACGGSDGASGDGSTTTTTTTSAPAGGDDPPPDDPPAEFDISQIEQSVIQIQSQGTFQFPEGLAQNAGATGTGFLISDDGYAVTNNHVVQGAATLAVSFSDSDNSINARIVAVSECSDLAVIQLTGDGYTPLSFREEAVSAGLQVFSAGFPAADEVDFDNLDFTLTSGIVGSTSADGETNWASVDSVLQHDAQILGGNSGGPLVDEAGHVVGVNYAGARQFDTNYAIAAQDARPVIDQLIAGNNVDSLGINGEATLFDEGLSGIFIRSVESGSPADAAGIEPGDVMISLESLVMATDGTMQDYCDVLRTQGDGAVMDFEVYRPSLDLVLEGQVNGDAIEIPLITQTAIEGGDVSNGNTEAPQESYEYTTVSDDQGLIMVSVPTVWGQVDGTPNPEFGPSIWASPDIEAWQGTWDVPGIIVESSSEFTAADIPDYLASQDLSGGCEDFGAEPYEDELYAGTLQVWGNCGGGGTYYVILAASPLDPDQDYLIRVEVQAVDSRDLEAADEALATFIASI